MPPVSALQAWASPERAGPSSLESVWFLEPGLALPLYAVHRREHRQSWALPTGAAPSSAASLSVRCSQLVSKARRVLQVACEATSLLGRRREGEVWARVKASRSLPASDPRTSPEHGWRACSVNSRRVWERRWQSLA